MIRKAASDVLFGDFPIAIGHSERNVLPTGYDLTEVEHSHDFSELVMILNGQGMHRVDDAIYAVAAGDVYVINPGTRHCFFDRKDMVHCNIMYFVDRLVLPEQRLATIPGYHALFYLEPRLRHKHQFESRLRLSRSRLGTLSGMVDQMAAEQAGAEPGYEAAMIAGLIRVMVFLSREYSHISSQQGQSLLRISHVISALEQSPAENWTVAQLASMAHMCRRNLTYVFKEALGVPPIDYLIGLRLDRAMQLLRDTDESIGAIAEAVGFADSNYFSRQFRSRLGYSPREYRKRFVSGQQ